MNAVIDSCGMFGAKVMPEASESQGTKSALAPSSDRLIPTSKLDIGDESSVEMDNARAVSVGNSKIFDVPSFLLSSVAARVSLDDNGVLPVNSARSTGHGSDACA